jgi:hypothetical protein
MMKADTHGGRIGWLERPGGDFPYYNGRPVALSGMQWILLMIATAIGFLVLIFGLGIFTGRLTGFVPVVLYVAIPLGVLALVSGRHWTALFGKVGWRDVLLMVAFAILNILVTLGVGAVLVHLTETTGNPGVAALAEQSPADILIYYLRAVPQLLGEELMTILPFLALMYLFTARMKTGRVTAIVLAWVLTGVLFAVEHLPTYDWNMIQALGGVGIARLALTLPYIMTKNLWVSTGAHVLNDWATFSVSLLGASLTHTAE